MATKEKEGFCEMSHTLNLIASALFVAGSLAFLVAELLK
jgi:hypothetical protein